MKNLMMSMNVKSNLHNFWGVCLCIDVSLLHL